MSEGSKDQRQQVQDQNKEVDSNNQEEDDDQGFYKQNQDESKEEKAPETQSKKTKKSKVIKKKKKREPTKRSSQDKKRNQYLNAANDSAMKIIDEMKNCYQKDLRLLEAKKKASSKLRYSGELQKLLRNVYVSQRFLDNGGLENIENWLQKLPDGTDSSLTLKKKMFSILLTLNVSDEHLERAPQLKKMINKSKRNGFLKDLCESILNRWNGNFF